MNTPNDRDDPNFVRDLEDSMAAVSRAAKWLSGFGYDCVVPPLKVRPTVDERAAYRDHGDMFISGHGKYNVRVEVKHRPKIHFTGRHDWPYFTMIVDAAHLWDDAEVKPLAYIIMNDDLTACAVVRGMTAERWQRVERYDPGKKRNRTFYEAPLEVVEWHSIKNPV